jgi:hypothetical protein
MLRLMMWLADTGGRIANASASRPLAHSPSSRRRRATPAAGAAVHEHIVALAQSLNGPGINYWPSEPEPPRNRRSLVRVPVAASPSESLSSYPQVNPQSNYLYGKLWTIIWLIPSQIIYMWKCELQFDYDLFICEIGTAIWLGSLRGNTMYLLSSIDNSTFPLPNKWLICSLFFGSHILLYGISFVINIVYILS